MKVAVVGGGGNGLACAWKLAQAGHEVTLFEQNELMRATSQSSSKLLHGGLRYLENGEIGLVREALAERDKWLSRVPGLTKSLPMIYPIFKGGRRSRWLVALGVWLYKLLSFGSVLPAPQWLSKEEVRRLQPELKSEGLIGGYRFYDGQMDDYGLGMWVAEQCRNMGVQIHQNVGVEKIQIDGQLLTKSGDSYVFERIVNVAGPWAEKLLQHSGLRSPMKLDLIRGAHLVVARPCEQAYLLEVPGEKRIFFVLPWKGKMLIGTTEIRQTLDQQIVCSDDEISYLLKAYNHWMVDTLSETDIESTFAGLRPLLSSQEDPSLSTREYAICREGQLVNVFGGKWTTSCALADRVVKAIN